jgi:hypothetical protein
MSTAAAIGKAVYTGTNGSNGNVVVGVANYTGNVNGGTVSPSIGTANFTGNVYGGPVGVAVGIPVYTGTNGSNGNVVSRIPTAGSLGTQGAVASPIPGPTYNPGS